MLKRRQGLALLCIDPLTDRPGSAALCARARARPGLQGCVAQVVGRIGFAGPLPADDGHTLIDSLLAIDFAGRDAALARLRGAPFTSAGLPGCARR
ncbi:MAG: YciI family protein [Bacteriovorax sp.]|nr:YciI family protein [Rhizobacter sp.]